MMRAIANENLNSATQDRSAAAPATFPRVAPDEPRVTFDVQHLHVRFGSHEVLTDVCLQIPAKAVTAIIGGEPVTLLGLGGASPFAVRSSGGTTSADTISSNVLAYPRWSGAASMTPQALSRRVGPCRISPVGGNRMARRRGRTSGLWGFDGSQWVAMAATGR